MLNRLAAAIAAASCCLAGVGCQSVAQCGDGCGRGASMAFQKYDCSCDGVCGECCGDDRGACGSGCDSACADGCCGDSQGEGLMGKLFGCTGCGECYWNEWHNDPPPLCEPCDRCGNYIGPGSVGYYRAPYRRDEGYAKNKSTAARPLELAEKTEIEQ
jgi:hypothetical protein